MSLCVIVARSRKLFRVSCGGGGGAAISPSLLAGALEETRHEVALGLGLDVEGTLSPIHIIRELQLLEREWIIF